MRRLSMCLKLLKCKKADYFLRLRRVLVRLRRRVRLVRFLRLDFLFGFGFFAPPVERTSSKVFCTFS
jgi:hypothetical protein